MKIFILPKLSVSSQINALLFLSRVRSGSDLVKNSSEIRERLREQHQVVFSIHRCWLGEVWSLYNLVSSGQVYILCLLRPHLYARRTVQPSSAGTSPY